MQVLLGSSQAPASAQDTFGLSGTLIAPRVQTDERSAGNQANVEWLMGCVAVGGESIVKGEIQKAGYLGGVNPSFVSQDSTTDWVIPHDFSNTYYVRATLSSGSNPTSSSGMDTWLSLVSEGANRSWRWKRDSVGTIEGVIKIEISDDANGDNIVATGFYKATVTVNPAE